MYAHNLCRFDICNPHADLSTIRDCLLKKFDPFMATDAEIMNPNIIPANVNKFDEKSESTFKFK